MELCHDGTRTALRRDGPAEAAPFGLRSSQAWHDPLFVQRARGGVCLEGYHKKELIPLFSCSHGFVRAQGTALPPAGLGAAGDRTGVCHDRKTAQ